MATVIVDGEEPPEVTEQELVSTEATEALAEAATEVAEIQANKEIECARIEAETERERIEANAEVQKEDSEEWRRNLEAQMASLEVKQAETQSILTQLTQAVELLTSPPQPEVDAAVEVTQESQEAPEPPVPTRNRKFHWI